MALTAKAHRGGQRSGSSGGVGKLPVDQWGNSIRITSREASMRYDSVETAILFDKDGNIIFNKSDGKRDSVAFSYDEVKLMKDSILTHNHPNGTSFSPEDLNLFVTHELHEIRAVGSNGTFSIKKGATYKNQQSGYAMNRDYNDYTKGTLKRKGDKTYADIQQRKNSGSISGAQFDYEVTNLNKMVLDSKISWFVKNAVSYGYDFNLEKKKGL